MTRVDFSNTNVRSASTPKAAGRFTIENGTSLSHTANATPSRASIRRIGHNHRRGVPTDGEGTDPTSDGPFGDLRKVVAQARVKVPRLRAKR